MHAIVNVVVPVTHETNSFLLSISNKVLLLRAPDKQIFPQTYYDDAVNWEFFFPQMCLGLLCIIHGLNNILNRRCSHVTIIVQKGSPENV